MSASTIPTPTAPGSRWGVQTSIIQPRQPAFWLFVVMLAIGGYLFIDEQSMFSQLPNALGLSWGLVLLYAVPVFVLVYRLDLFEREPVTMLAAALLWGGVVAVMLAGYANDAWLSVLGKVAAPDFVSDWGAAIVAPFTEETLKLIGVVILFLIAPAEFDGVMDGFVYGALVGLGFTVTEDVSYFIHATASFGAGDATQPVIDTALIRIVAGGLYGHVLFAGLTGMGFAYFVTRKREAFNKRLAVLLFFIAASAGAHALWDSPWMQTILATAGNQKPSTLQWVEFGTVKGLPFLILLVVMVLLATRSESDTFRSIVAGEPDPDVVRQQELPALGSLWARRNARSAASRARGPMAGRLTGKLQAAQIEYAMVRSRAASLDDATVVAQRAKIHQIRTELEALPAIQIPASAPGYPPGYAPVQPQMPQAAPPFSPTPVPAAPAVIAPVPAAAAAAPAATEAPAAALAAVPEAAAAVAETKTRGRSTKAEKAAEKAAEAEKAAAEKPVETPAPTPAATAPAAPAAAAAATGPAIYLVPPGTWFFPMIWARSIGISCRPHSHLTNRDSDSSCSFDCHPDFFPRFSGLSEKPVETAAPAAAAAATGPAIYLVPPGGMPAWAAPDPAQPPMVNLPERLELVVDSRAGAWALVRAQNGWRGWVDGRRLLERQ